MKYSLQILKNKNLFKRRKYPSPNALNIKYFWTLSYNYLENGIPQNVGIISFLFCVKEQMVEKNYAIERPVVKALHLKLYVVFVYLKLSIHCISAAIINSINEGSCDFNGKVKGIKRSLAYLSL